MTDAPAGSSRELSYFFAVPLRRWPVVLLTTLVFGLGALALLRVVPTSATASATVSLDAFSADLFPDAQPVDQTIDVAAESEVARSPEVIAAAAESLGRKEDAEAIRAGVDASGAAGGTTVTLTYQGSTAAEATDIVNSVADAYLQYRASRAMERQASALRLINDRLKEARAALDVVNARLSEARPGSTAAANAESARTVLTGQLADLTSRQNTASTMVMTSGEVIDPAEAKDAEIFPRPELFVATALLLGLAVGMLLAFLEERLDRKLRRESQLVAAAGAPVLAVLSPRVYDVHASGEDLEQLRLLRARLLAAVEDNVFSVMLIDVDDRPSLSRLGRHLATLVATAGLPVTMLRVGRVDDRLRQEERDALESMREDGHGENLAIEQIADADIDLVDAFHGPRVTQRVGDLQKRGRIVVVVPAEPLERSEIIMLSHGVEAVLVVGHHGRSYHRDLAALCDDARASGAMVVGSVLCTKQRGSKRRRGYVRSTTGVEQPVPAWP